MKLLKPITALSTTALIAFSTFANWHSSLSLQDTKTLQIDAESIEKIKIEAGSGSLSITGSDTNTIQVVAQIFQEEPHDNYQLSLANENTYAMLISENKGFNKSTRIDLEVQLPSRYAVNIQDGSGPISLSNVRTAKIKDGSGSIFITDIAGDVRINDGSGSITVESIKGSLKIDDGSGSITAESIKGFVEIEDGSGNIDIKNVGQEVSVSDGSGSISVDQAASFTLVDDGSGSVNIKNVAGKVNMGRK
ncbi:hypothetical protein Q4489_09890 [Thalassotalea sp. 1_MG-2023]|uniref:hypothetical protein n=1 Tax=Thalassotalea sp. 1_MG-2023 TaxID=3062680 RepID=UPI0026E1B8AB|nr:hypothetical protein [Thalassotalea sp. 1_MG-2023]MDO6427325.1 hypothetical protein [Thalassotalea sp. 1_MG-2023]